MNRLLFLLSGVLLLFPLLTCAQDRIPFADHSIAVDNLADEDFTQFFHPMLKNTQFIMVGEQHFIQEAAQVTQAIYTLAATEGYQTLCIENDQLAVQKMTALASADDPLAAARDFHQEYPFTLAFYENEEDYDLLSHVVKSGGTLWGIDQTLMSQFRYNFSYLIDHSDDVNFVTYLSTLKDKATQAYETAIENKQFQAIYYFQYDEATQQQLSRLATTPAEKEVIFQLNKTKEIYDYNLSGQHYLNNQTRGALMKSNFLRYYRAAQQTEALPKVVFKLGAYHTFRGLTPTNIYDIANLVSELAIMNDKKSLHLLVRGISGKQGVGFPFAPEPVVDFDNTNEFPPEIQEWLTILPKKKYVVLNLVPLRPKARQYSEALQALLFTHDVLVLVNDAQAVTTF